VSMISIGGVPLPNPTKYSVKRSDLDSESTTRNEAGYLQRDRVRAGTYSIDVSWRVQRADYKKVTDATAAASFSVTFFDPFSVSTKTATMYAGDKQGELVSYTDDASKSLWELSVSLIEY
jgi:hypothetical protein